MVYITDGLNTARVLIKMLLDKGATMRDETKNFIPCEDEILTEAYFKEEKVVAIYADDLDHFLDHVLTSVHKEQDKYGNEYQIEVYKIHTVR